MKIQHTTWVAAGGKSCQSSARKARSEQPDFSNFGTTPMVRQAKFFLILTEKLNHLLDILHEEIIHCCRCSSPAPALHRCGDRKAARIPRVALLGKTGTRIRRSGGNRSGTGPGPRSTRRQSHRPHLYRRPFGRLALPRSLPDRFRVPAPERLTRRWLATARSLHHQCRALRPSGQQTHPRGDP